MTVKSAPTQAASTAEVEQKSNGKVLDEILSLAEATAKEIGMSRSELELVKDVYAKGATDQELALFIRTASRLKLSIEARQIFLVKRWDSSLQREVATPQVSIDGQRLVAERTGEYVPGRAPTFQYEADRLISASAFVKRFVKGEWHEIEAPAFYAEYVQKNKEGKPNAMWSKYPHVMLAKCAESLALRKAFPNDLSGVYTDAEMGTDPREIIGNEIPVKDPAPARPTKGQLVEKARPANVTPEFTGPPEEEAMGVEHSRWRQRIGELMKAIGKGPAETLKFFDAAPPVDREAAYRKVLRESVKSILAGDRWPYTEDGTTEYLEKFGITAIADASIGQIEPLVDEMVKDGLID